MNKLRFLLTLLILIIGGSNINTGSYPKTDLFEDNPFQFWTIGDNYTTSAYSLNSTAYNANNEISYSQGSYSTHEIIGTETFVDTSAYVTNQKTYISTFILNYTLWNGVTDFNNIGRNRTFTNANIEITETQSYLHNGSRMLNISNYGVGEYIVNGSQTSTTTSKNLDTSVNQTTELSSYVISLYNISKEVVTYMDQEFEVWVVKSRSLSDYTVSRTFDNNVQTGYSNTSTTFFANRTGSVAFSYSDTAPQPYHTSYTIYNTTLPEYTFTSVSLQPYNIVYSTLIDTVAISEISPSYNIINATHEESTLTINGTVQILSYSNLTEFNNQHFHYSVFGPQPTTTSSSSSSVTSATSSSSSTSNGENGFLDDNWLMLIIIFVILTTIAAGGGYYYYKDQDKMVKKGEGGEEVPPDK